jgi:NAD(P)-dependent dehydrogenase (short-subunit alcohol dehydrogenase family)
VGSFDGRTVFVTGGAGALGEAVVARFRAGGANVVAPSRDDLDLTDEEAVTRAYAKVPGLWASVHLAGGFAMGPLVGTSLAAFRAQHDMNATTCFLACREAARAMHGTGGRIVNVASRPALVPTAGMVGYATSKAVVAALTRHAAEELRGAGILVNAVAPSTIDTPANRKAMPKADFAAWPKAAEIAETIAWLASPENTLTSGAVVPVYGKV